MYRSLAPVMRQGVWLDWIARRNLFGNHALVRLRWAWLWLILVLPAVYPALAYNVAAHAYDAATAHVYRGIVFSQAISDGALYPRWTQFLHLGLGSPIFTFQGPLPYYALDLLYRLGIDHPAGWGILIALGLLAAGLGAYLLVKVLTGQRWPALLAAVAYLYAPYVLRNAFERGSNEAFSMFLYPWVLWTLVALAKRPGAVRFVVAALIWALCIGSHVLAPLMLAPLAGSVALALAWHHRTLTPPLALLAGGLLMAFVWLPIIPEQNWVQLDRDFIQTPYTKPARHPLPLAALLAPPAVYDVQRDNNNTGDRVGLIQSVLLALGLPAAWLAWRRRRRKLACCLFIASAAGLLLFWLLTAASDPLWLWLEPPLTRLEFRSRWMGMQALMAAGVAGMELALLPPRRQYLAGLGLAGVLLAGALPSLYVNLQHAYAPLARSLSLADVRRAEIKQGGNAFASFSEFLPANRRLRVSEMLNQGAGLELDPKRQPLASPMNGLQILSTQVRTGRWDLSLHASGPVTATLKLLQYPRWQAYLDGRPTPSTTQPGTGFVQVAVPPGDHLLSMRYGSTPAEFWGFVISGVVAAGLLLLLVLAVFSGRQGGGSVGPATGGRPAAVGTLPDQEFGREWAAPAWLLASLTALLVFKVAFVDGHTTWLRCVSGPQRVCGAQSTVDVPFAGGPRLVGYSAPHGPFHRGDEVEIRLFWQGEPGGTRHLHSFVHIRNSKLSWPLNPRTGSDIWAEHNHPTPGGVLVTDYLPGRIYEDDHKVKLPRDLPPGQYLLETGWFDPASGEQLDPVAAAVQPPMKVLWRSVLLPSIDVGS